MNSTLSKIIIFATGAAIGSVVTWKLVSDKYEKQIAEETKIIRGHEKPSVEEEDAESSDNEDAMSEYEAIIKDANYAAYAQKVLRQEEKEGEDEEIMTKPYLIDQDEWDESEYETETLYCFEDGVITNEMEEELEDAEDLVGDEAVEWLQESGKDYIYVRNENNETDYEILRDCRRYSEVD